MDSARFATLRRLFEELAPLSPAARDQKLASIGDPALRADVLRLLAADAVLPGAAALDRDASAFAPEAQDLFAPGTRIGRYVVVRRIGGGGMGTVVEATQDQPRRKVALKLLRLDSASADGARRFRTEAEITGRLDHPHVAKIFEAGIHALQDGVLLPFLALEYVEDAEPLTRALDRSGASVIDRVRALADVADAVHHGHVKGVLHRDLKPGNVLMGSDGRVRVIDFGIGRIVDAAYEADAQTRTGQILGTPAYMSPEQFAGEPAAIDARSDVWALGVLAFEVLCGRVPFVTSGIPITDVARAIVDHAPPRPSTLRPGLPRELDWIVGKALEKDPRRRYASASEFAADLRRFLQHEPVLAGPPTTAYRVACFVRRHRAGVAAAALVAASLVAGGIAALVGMVRAQDAEARATAAATDATAEARRAIASNELLFDVLRSASSMPKGPETPVADVLRIASARTDAAFEHDERGRAQMQIALGASQVAISEYDAAIANLQAGAAGLEHTLGPRHAQTLAAWSHLAGAWLDRDHVDDADASIQRALPIAQETLDPLDETVLALRHHAALVFHRRGDDAAAIAALRVLVADRERSPQAERQLRRELNSLAVLLHAQGALAESEALQRRVVELTEREDGKDSLEADFARKNLASLLVTTGRFDEAEPLLRTALAHEIAILGPSARQALTTKWNLMQLLHQSGRFDEAIALGHEVADAYEHQSGAELDAAVAHAELGTACLNAQRLDEARRELERARDLFIAARGPDDVDTLVVTGNLISLALRQGRAADVADDVKHCVEVLAGKLGEHHPALLAARARLADYSKRTGDIDTAIEQQVLVVAGHRATYGADHWQTIQSEASLAVVHALAGHRDEAEEMLRAALARADAAFPPQDWRPAYFRMHLGSLERERGALDDAEHDLLAAHAILAQQLPADSTYVADSRSALAALYRARGQPERAAQYEDSHP